MLFATQSDLDQILKLEQVCFPDPWTKESISNYLTDCMVVDSIQRRGILVWQEENVICAYLIFHMIFDQAEILRIGVLPQFRRKMYARKLIQNFTDYCAKRQVANIYLEVRKSNAKAQDLYVSTGFVMEGTRKCYYADTNEDAILYKKNI